MQDVTHEEAKAAAASFIDAQSYDGKAAVLWPTGDAPECMLSWDLCDQDDRDWFFAFPPGFDPPWWTDKGTSFGCCDVVDIELPNGWVVRVGYHS